MATSEPTRAAIDSGRTAEKVPFGDPATSPLGTDDEAAGMRPQTGSPRQAGPSGDATSRETARHMEPSPGRASAVTHEGARPMNGLDPAARTFNRTLFIAAFAVLALGAILVVLWSR